MRDQQVTCVGRWLRQTGLDELPQLILVERSAKEQGGTVVKRIGDEVLATFAAPAAAEQFVAALPGNARPRRRTRISFTRAVDSSAFAVQPYAIL
jgi:class 3 adenylate cyclase